MWPWAGLSSAMGAPRPCTGLGASRRLRLDGALGCTRANAVTLQMGKLRLTFPTWSWGGGHWT